MSRAAPSHARNRRDCATGPEGPLRTLGEVVKDYRRRFGAGAREEAAFFASQRDLPSAVRLAARARTSADRRHPHQYRIPEAVLGRCEAVLLTMVPALRRAKDFEAVLEIVETSIGDIRGVGELLVYDTATRIGAFLGLRPRAVHLHAGVRRGARALGLPVTQGRIALRDLPRPLHGLDGASAEDILCIYKDSEAFRRVGERR